LDTVRIARDFGTVSQLLPEPLTLIEAPYNLVGAIRATMVFLSWQENLPAKEIPPKRIWLDAKKLDAWFKSIEKKREDEMKGQSNDIEGWDGEMKQNEAARSILIDD
jgi:hypothetical protein